MFQGFYMKTSSLNAICSDILSPEDLIISDELFDNTLKEKIVTQIKVDKKKPYVSTISVFNNTDFTRFWFQYN